MGIIILMYIPPDKSLSALRLRQLISPNLPTGAFSYSQGMEWAVECGWIESEQETRQWLKSVLADSLKSLELPILLRLLTAASQDHPQDFLYWSQWLYASRETRELRSEEKQRARALYTLLKKLPDSGDWPELQHWQSALSCSQLAGYALAASHWQIGSTDLLQGYTWSWLENAIAVAIKLVPLGQSQGQRLLYELSPEIIDMVEQATLLEDDQIGASTTALAIASSLHETQYSRLFRS